MIITNLMLFAFMPLLDFKRVVLFVSLRQGVNNGQNKR
jgi:hypothetical protein